MKFLIALSLVLFYNTVFSQKNIELYTQKVENGYVVLGDNSEQYPVSVKIDFTLKNLLVDTNINTFVLPAKSKKDTITFLKVNDNTTGYQFSFKYSSYFGNVNLTKFDTNFIYHLPFKKDNSFKLHQGYNGNFSHQNENALDFTMPIGTDVLAARGGVVVEVVDNNNQGCNNRSCLEFNNYIIILHNDGTYAKYVHLDCKGAKVKVGEIINQDQIIALSGNTGYTSGPHLHFEVNVPSTKNKNTVPTLFKISNSNATYLQEGLMYYKNY